MELMDRDRVFGGRIKELRRMHRLTQSELGEMVGLTQQSITAWETGRSYPDVYTLLRLAEIYQVSVDWLLGLAETAEPSRLVLKRTREGRKQNDLARAGRLSPELQEAILALLRLELRRTLDDPGVACHMPPKLLEALMAGLQDGQTGKGKEKKSE